MARQAGPFYITGSYENICFYKMGGKYYARMKSSLDGKRVKKDPVFSKTMRYAGLLAKASKIGSILYRTLPKEERKHELYRKLTGQAMLLLKEGKTAIEILELLKWKVPEPVALKKKNTELRFDFADKIIRRVFSVELAVQEEALCDCDFLPP
jgi:hypothetical protein